MAQEPAAPIEGYVRCGVLHRNTEWKFEVLGMSPAVGVLDIETADGIVSIALNRVHAIDLQQKLQAFLAEWPKDRLLS